MAERIDPADQPPEVYRYTRRQALEDGVLVDLSRQATEVGFVLPVACTAAVWKYVVPADSLRQRGQSESGRCHDLLWTLRSAVLKADRRAKSTDRLEFEALFLMPSARPEKVRLAAVCGPGDEGEPVVTIMLPDED